MDLKRDDHVKLAEKLKQIQQDAEAINKSDASHLSQGIRSCRAPNCA
jgi:hypothetical protein